MGIRIEQRLSDLMPRSRLRGNIQKWASETCTHDLLEADFRPASLKAFPWPDFSVVRHSGVIASVGEPTD